MADKLCVSLFLSEASLFEEEEGGDPLVVKALIGLANAQPQLLPLPSSTEDETQEEEEEEEEEDVVDEDEVITKPLNIPPHLTLSFMQWFIVLAITLGFPPSR